jgi:hypothetical protein
MTREEALSFFAELLKRAFAHPSVTRIQGGDLGNLCASKKQNLRVVLPQTGHATWMSLVAALGYTVLDNYIIRKGMTRVENHHPAVETFRVHMVAALLEGTPPLTGTQLDQILIKFAHPSLKDLASICGFLSWTEGAKACGLRVMTNEFKHPTVDWPLGKGPAPSTSAFAGLQVHAAATAAAIAGAPSGSRAAPSQPAPPRPPAPTTRMAMPAPPRPTATTARVAMPAPSRPAPPRPAAVAATPRFSATTTTTMAPVVLTPTVRDTRTLADLVSAACPDDDDDDGADAVAEPDVEAAVFRPFSVPGSVPADTKLPLYTRDRVPAGVDAGLLGAVSPSGGAVDGDSEFAFLNVSLPFCLVTCGVQGAGKSHTIGTLLEMCLLNKGPATSLSAPMAVLVLHYDLNPRNICEATGVLNPAAGRRSAAAGPPLPGIDFHPRDKTVVLVSPDCYRDRKRFYGDGIDVRPLMFEWGRLTAGDLKILMHVEEGGTQLYVANLLALLRKYQRQGCVPPFEQFSREVQEACCSTGQSGPLQQRLDLLAALVDASDMNRRDFGDSAVGSGGSDVHSVMRAGTLVIADLSDPLRTKEEANGIFHVLLQQFRSVDVGSSGGKLLVLDEAHKFVSGTDGLSREIVNSVRLMRHEGMRLAVSTQSPLVLSPELLELTTVAVVHRFHSHDWFAFLGRKIRLPPDAFHDIAKLDDGMALLSASKPLTLASGETIDAVGLPIRVRPRLTADHGSTLMANRRRAKMK